MKILICGAGAIGSNLVARLVPDLKGEHEITVLDKDKVESRNLQGTQFFSPEQEGLQKTEALQFNIYKITHREIKIINQKLTEENITILSNYHVVIDTFDNYQSRQLVQDYCSKNQITLLHCGFSDQMTFAIEFGEHYQVPSDITSGKDICEMPGAAAFVNCVAALGALVVEEFIRANKKLEVTGGKFIHSLIQ